MQRSTPMVVPIVSVDVDDASGAVKRDRWCMCLGAVWVVILVHIMQSLPRTRAGRV